jgi:hypothetical protein
MYETRVANNFVLEHLDREKGDGVLFCTLLEHHMPAKKTEIVSKMEGRCLTRTITKYKRSLVVMT